MPSLQVTANPGVDGNRISVIIVEEFSGAGCSVVVNTYDYNRYEVVVTMGFNFTSGNNVDWDSAAGSINAAAGAFLTAVGASGDTSADIVGSGTAGGSAGAGEGQYYSPGLVKVRHRWPKYVKRFNQVGN